MKLRVFQIAFVAVALLFAALVVRRGQPHLLSTTQIRHGANDMMMPDEPFGPMHKATTQENQAAIASIQAQLTAFHKEDFDAAMHYQSSAMHHSHQSTATFQQMMQTEYPAFLHFQSVTFNQAQTPDSGNHLFVPVTLHMADQSEVQAIYMMSRENGVYKVNGVRGGMQNMQMMPPSEKMNSGIPVT